ncbi:MAG: 1-acyl-sn-glycerol-3-phosphate acyltransferase [Gemmatimonadota bacterium]|nr:1-acyl-sn-glycerol-3-phosphate acyltransferase [Gemmatimonadota bacterium]
MSTDHHSAKGDDAAAVAAPSPPSAERPHPAGDSPASSPRLARAARSLSFIAIYCLYLTFAVGLGQRVVVLPLITLFPRRRRAITRWWLGAHARGTLALARALSGVRLTIRGSIPSEPIVAVMNHQSLLDIPLGIALIPGPYPLIPTRDRYRQGIPGVSQLARLARFPFVSQGRTARREELVSLRRAAEQVAAGEQSLLIFPEGHRTRDGEITDFMKPGLKLVLARARRPVYCIVADGMWRSRTFADAALRFAGSRIHGVILGPFAAPSDANELDAFIDEIRARMIGALHDLRRRH